MSSLSCFIEGTSFQFAWDSVSLGWFKDCPRKYQLSMGLGLKSMDEWGNAEELGPEAEGGWATRAESVHLRWGQLYHSALENYDRSKAEGQDHESALKDVVLFLLLKTWDTEDYKCVNGHDLCHDGASAGPECPYCEPIGKPWRPDHPNKTRENLIRTVIWYLEQFHDDPARTVILADGRPAVELSFRLPLGDLSYGGKQVLLCGHLDRIVEFQGGVYVMDHKTASTTLSSSYFDQYDLDGQMSGYALAGRLVFHSPIRGVIIDAAQVAVGFSRFARGLTYRTEAQLEEWVENTQWWIGQAYVMALEGYWPMNDRSCSKYGGCPFRGICNKDPSVRDRFLESNYVRHSWNPLETR